MPIWSHLPVERYAPCFWQADIPPAGEGLLEHNREGAVGAGPRSMTVLDALIDPVEKGAITSN